MPFPSPHRINVVGACCCFILLAISYYFQYADGLEPCSLCVLQRGLFLLLGSVLLADSLHRPKRFGSQMYGLLILAISMSGGLLAARQVWLQMHPPAPAEICMPEVSYLLTHLPLNQALQSLLQGSGNCAAVTWRLAGWSIAHWSLVCFLVFGLLGISHLLGFLRAKSGQSPQ